MPKFEPKPTKTTVRTKRISRTYRFAPETIILIQQAIKDSYFHTATALIEEATLQFANYILTSPHEYKKEK